MQNILYSIIVDKFMDYMFRYKINSIDKNDLLRM